jgi:hypothetical protein
MVWVALKTYSHSLEVEEVEEEIQVLEKENLNSSKLTSLSNKHLMAVWKQLTTKDKELVTNVMEKEEKMLSSVPNVKAGRWSKNLSNLVQECTVNLNSLAQNVKLQDKSWIKKIDVRNARVRKLSKRRRY